MHNSNIHKRINTTDIVEEKNDKSWYAKKQVKVYFLLPNSLMLHQPPINECLQKIFFKYTTTELVIHNESAVSHYLTTLSHALATNNLQ